MLNKNPITNVNPITITTVIKAPIEKVWEYWNSPEHIPKWAFADDSWEAYDAKNDLKTGGKFSTIMAAKDKSTSFEFGGVYTNVEEHKVIEYDMSDKWHVKIVFEEVPEGTKITQTFDPEQENTEEVQRSGWQAILDNFKKHTEQN